MAWCPCFPKPGHIRYCLQQPEEQRNEPGKASPTTLHFPFVRSAAVTIPDLTCQLGGKSGKGKLAGAAADNPIAFPIGPEWATSLRMDPGIPALTLTVFQSLAESLNLQTSDFPSVKWAWQHVLLRPNQWLQSAMKCRAFTNAPKALPAEGQAAVLCHKKDAVLDSGFIVSSRQARGLPAAVVPQLQCRIFPLGHLREQLVLQYNP